MSHRMNRRTLCKFAAAGTFAALCSPGQLFSAPSLMRTKTIPKTQEPLPVIGMGTWRTFNVGTDPQLLNARTAIVKAFLSAGGGLIDSSPMYGSAPDVMGYALEKLGKPAKLFSAEKVWSHTLGKNQNPSCEPGEEELKLDLPTVRVSSDGTQQEIIVNGLQLDQVRNLALGMHKSMGDGAAMPAGNSGSRIVCGIIN